MIPVVVPNEDHPEVSLSPPFSFPQNLTIEKVILLLTPGKDGRLMPDVSQGSLW